MKIVLLGVAAAALLAAAPPAFAGSVVHTYSSGPMAKRIPDRGRLVVPLFVRDPRRMRWISVRLRIDHPRVADLSVRLVAPDGSVSTLVTHVGGAKGSNFGSGRHGCRGRMTTISELGRRSIARAAAPFVGTYGVDDEGGQTENDLIFLDGIEPQGRWKLVVADSRSGEVGYLRCWQLRIAHGTPEIASARAGHVRAALSWLAIDQQLLSLRLAVWRHGRRVAVGAVPRERIWCVPRCLRPPGHRSLVVRDLDGDRDPEVMLRLYGTGAHCCAITIIYTYRPGGFVRFGRVWDNYAEYRIVDLDHDGEPEFRSADGKFCFSCLYPDVRFPIQIWRFRRGRLVDVTRSFPHAIRRDARQFLRGYRSMSRKDRREYGHPVLDAYVADTALLGEIDLGWRELDAAARRGELGRQPARYERGLRRYLEKKGYLPSARSSQSSRQ
jgi:subtilisin-like proprotein convertase family protein